MNALSFLLVLTGVVLNALAQTLLKHGTNRLGPVDFALSHAFEIGWRVLRDWPFLLGFACYGVSLVVWIAALTGWVGIAFICLGVTMIARQGA